MKEKQVKIPIYGGTFIVKVVDSWKKTNKEFNYKIEKYTEGCAFWSVDDTGSSKFYMVFKGIPSTSTMVHESVHLANSILKYRGIKSSHLNDEAQAYLVEWIFEQAEEFIEKLKLEKNENKYK